MRCRLRAGRDLFAKKAVRMLETLIILKKLFIWQHEAKGEDGMLFCVGSLYLVGEIKTLLLKK